MKVGGYSSGISGQKSTVFGDGKSLNSLEAGDTFKAHILNVRPNEVTMRLSDGSTLTARSMVTPDARIGEETTFRVRSNADGQIMVEFVKDELSNSVLDIVRNSLAGSGAPDTDDNIAFVKTLMSKGLPIDSEFLQKALGALSSFDGLSLDKLLFLLEEQFPLSKSNVEQLNLLVDNNASVLDDFSAFLKHLSSLDDPSLKNMLLSMFSAANDSPESAFLIKAVFDNLNVVKNNIDAFDSSIARDVLKQFVPGEVLDRLDDSKLKELLSHQLGGDTERLLKDIRGAFVLDLNDLNGDAVNGFYQKLSNNLMSAMAALKNVDGADLIDSSLSKLKQDINFMNHINDFKEFVQIPLQLPNQQTQSDLYVFKNKKGQKLSKDNASVLLALDLAYLGHLEIFVQKKFRDIDCQFRSCDESINKFIQANSSRLMSLLAQKGYRLQFVSFKTIDTPFDVTKELDSVPRENNKRYTFDMRV